MKRRIRTWGSLSCSPQATLLHSNKMGILLSKKKKKKKKAVVISFLEKKKKKKKEIP